LIKRLFYTSLPEFSSTLRARNTVFKAAIAQNLEKTIWPLLASGEIKPIINAVFPAEKAADAHKLMESSEHIGKIVLEFMVDGS
jgi:NADPH:quinone reductase